MAYLDTFTDTDETVLSDHTPDSENFTWSEIDGPITIVGDRLVGSGVYRTSITPDPDEEAAEIEIVVDSEIVGDHEWYLYFRYDGSGGTFGNSYAVNFFAFSDGTVGLSIFRRGGEEAFAEFDNGSLTPGTHRLRAVLDGDTFTVYLDDEEVLTWTDPSPMTAGPMTLEQYQSEGATAYVTAYGSPSLPDPLEDPPSTNLHLDRLLLEQIGTVPGPS